MKLRSTTPDSSMSFVAKVAAVSAVIVMAFAVPIQFFSSAPVSADDYDAQINAIRRKVAGYEKEANALRSKANTLQNTLNQLATDKAKIQAEIDLYQKQYDKLVKDIKETEEQIAENRRVSGELIVTSSLSGDVPLIVRLAASKNLADYIEGEASLIAVRDTIVEKTEENERLKKELEKKKDEVKDILNDQQVKRDLLAQKEADQRRILAETKGNEAEYQKLIKRGNDEINSLRAQQEAARAALNTGGGSGGALASTDYPWKNAPTNYNDFCMYPSGLSGADYWGYCVRQCTSYVAWKLAKDGKRGFSGMGHAYSWWGLPSISGTPKRGDVIVSPAGGYGHVMYVEYVSGGNVYYTDYNGAGGPVSPGQGHLPLSLATDNYNYKVVRFN